MEVLKVKRITVPDNINGRPEGVITPFQNMYDAEMSPEAHAEMLEMITQHKEGSRA